MMATTQQQSIIGRIRDLFGNNEPERVAGATTPAAHLPAQIVPARVGPVSFDPLDFQPATVQEELARTFFETAQTGFFEDLDAILADDVIYLVPGNSRASGFHRGREAVKKTLATPVGPRSTIEDCEITELLFGPGRSVGFVLLTGHDDAGQRFQLEVVFHLRCDNGRIVAITEYSGDQYLADRLIE